MKRLIKCIALLGVLLATLSHVSAAEVALRLENPRIAVEIDRQSGAIRSIHDKEQDVVYPQTGIGFEIVTTEGTLRSEQASSVTTKAGQTELKFVGNGLNVTLHYRLGASDHFVEKWLTIKASDGKPYFLKSVVLEDMDSAAFSEMHFHDDNTIWQCPINLFLRAEKGGCFAGLAYPYWELKQNDNEGFRLGYQPNYQAATNEINSSEKYFIGVYRKEGIHRYSQGPYPGAVQSPYVNFSGSGLTQHFKGRIPAAAVKSEVLDWGEVWAMQAFMKHALPDLPLPEKGYWVWQNGWWAKLWDIKTSILDQLKEAGIHDIMTAHTWYGRGTHPIAPPYIDQMHTDPMGFPKDSGLAGMPGPAGPTAGLHSDHSEVTLDKFAAGQFTSQFSAPPAMEAFHAYGQKIGVHVSSFTLPIVYFNERPEWGALDQNGKVNEYLFGRKLSCPAHDDYMDHMLELFDHVITKYDARWWGFDGRWLSYWEVPKYRPGPKGLGFDLCYAENHGHLPGDNLYKEWKNIENLVRELRRRHPGMCLEQYYGMKRGGPWAMRYFNADENYYETNGVIMNRFQAWHNGNDRFRPVYKNMAAVIGKSAKDFRNSLLSTISVTSYAKFGEGFYGLALQENRTFLKTWRAWATKHHDYLKVKRDLFDCPGFQPIDGSVHIIKDRGFIFLFSNNHQGKAVRASIPMNRWIQLEENPKAVYQIKEVYPNKGKVLATLRYGYDFLYDMPKDSAVVLSLEPAPEGSELSQSVDLERQVQLVPAFSSIAPPKPRTPNAWHWPLDTLIENGAASPDVSTNKVHARLSGQELCEGAIGKALQFKAGNKGLALGDLGLQAPVTLSFWLKSDVSPADARILSQLDGPSTQSGAIRMVGSTLQVWNAKDWSVVVNGLSNEGIWQHVALVYQADGTVTGYLNGQKRQTANSSFDFKGAKAGLGSPFLGQWGTPFVGALDDLRIYKRPLSDREIETLYPAEFFSQAHAAAEIELSPMGKLARDEYLIPVRPGKVSGAPFWNVRSHQFMYAPSFDFNELEGAKSYRFTLKASDGHQYSFNASKPDATLEPIWLKIPSGRANLKVEALDANGQVLKEVGQRGFHRAAMYNGPYNKQLMSYRTSAQWGLKTLFHRNYFVAWMQPGVPPEDYRKQEDHGDVWGIPYPSKLLGATVAGAALYATITPRPADADEAIAIGRKAADYLISLNLAAGTPLEFMPPTYAGAGAFNKYQKPFMVRKNVMMNFPCVAADAYLSLFDATKDKKYLEAAKKVADTYRKLQLPEGTWYQVVDNNTGKGAYPMHLNPVKVVRFADRLVNQYGLGEYQEMRDRAFDYVMGSTMKTFNWQAQYEDAAPMPAYRNLSPGQACEFADYLLQRSKKNPEYVDMALELMRFAEGQYVSWENPKPSGCGIPVLNSPNWILPCVSEQTGYFMPVNFSSSHLIETFANAYLATGNKVYLAKAKDLANTLLVAQQNHKGDYPTYLIPHSGDGKFEDVQNTWINCTVYTIRSVMRLAEALESEKTNYSADTTIVNGTDWKDTAGKLIVAHEGEIARFGDTFYWYGSSYANNPRGKFRMTAGPVWNGVQVYSSTDLKNWTYKGVCLPRPERGFGKVGATGRSHVMYNEKTKKYVMWYRWFVAMPASFLMVATADHPEGPFTPHGPQQMGTSTGFGSDMNVFQDDDGKGYVIYCDHNAPDANPANGWRYAIRIDSLSDDYLTSNRDGVVIFDKGCEAPAMVKHRGKYIAVASGVHGWAGSDTKCATADSPLGPYKKQAGISEQRTWGSQVTDLLYLKESDQVMALCDQWWNPDKSDIEKSRYLFLPLDIDVNTGRVQMKYLERWSPLQPNQ